MPTFEHISTESQSAIPSALRAHYEKTNGAMRLMQPRHPGYRGHTQRSRAMIWRSAETALRRAPAGVPKTALVLGAGNCLDIPLKYLVEKFDRTRLVDIDTAACEKALQALPEQYLGKVSLLGADITGAVATLGQGLDRLSKQRSDAKTLPRAFKELLGAVMQTATQPDLGGDYTFVSSHLLISQLTALPISFLRDRLQAQNPSLARSLETADGAVGRAAETFLDHTQTGHIAQLAGLVASSGMVHLADTLYEIAPGGQARQMFNPEAVGPAIERHFESIHHESWEWKLDQGSYQVIAFSLQPKPD